ncbi:unnamed protein product, partial [Effrenium voratum]
SHGPPPKPSRRAALRTRPPPAGPGEAKALVRAAESGGGQQRAVVLQRCPAQGWCPGPRWNGTGPLRCPGAGGLAAAPAGGAPAAAKLRFGGPRPGRAHRRPTLLQAAAPEPQGQPPRGRFCRGTGRCAASTSQVGVAGPGRQRFGGPQGDLPKDPAPVVVRVRRMAWEFSTWVDSQGRTWRVGRIWELGQWPGRCEARAPMKGAMENVGWSLS